MQGRRRGAEDPAAQDAIRIGYTCSKKVGNAVARNRAKRRLRAAAAAVIPLSGRPGWDYVLVGRAGATAARPFADLLRDLEAALDRVHAPRRPKGPRKGGGTGGETGGGAKTDRTKTDRAKTGGAKAGGSNPPGGDGRSQG